jgi:hypothetical protein
MGQELWPGTEAASPSERVGASIVRRAWRVNQIVPHASLGAVHLYSAAGATNVDLPLQVHPQNVNSTAGNSPPVSMSVEGQVVLYSVCHGSAGLGRHARKGAMGEPK